ncbi:MAG: murein biosynthesis integral membrane protein MurJ [Cyanophyceae cyanobacterium]
MAHNTETHANLPERPDSNPLQESASQFSTQSESSNGVNAPSNGSNGSVDGTNGTGPTFDESAADVADRGAGQSVTSGPVAAESVAAESTASQPAADQSSEPSAGKGRSLLSIATIVAAATLLSKVAGLVRQQTIAAAFGAGPVVNAYSFSYIIPGFLLILLGGINGPFHSAMVSVLAKSDRRDAARIIETVTTIVGAVLLVVSVGLVLGAETVIDLLAPGLTMNAAEAARQGLDPATLPDLAQTRAIAILQLQVMAPIALLAGFIGIGFGSLNAADQYWIPSISPLLSSFVTIGAIAGYGLGFANGGVAPHNWIWGAIFLAGGTTVGALLQWLIQLPTQAREGLGKLRLRLDWKHPGVRKVLTVMGPATLASGMLQVNLYTDLHFASYIPQAAAALNYANLLVQTPLGLVSSIILVPFLPVLSRLAGPSDRPALKGRIRQGLMITALTMLPLSAVMVPLSRAIVRVVYERGAFSPEDSALVASVVLAASLGMVIYLSRDVLVRVFYALGDAQTPFRISLINIFVNVGLDWLLVQRFGAPGIVLATVGVNLTALVAFLVILNNRLDGFPWSQWLPSFGGTFVLSLATGALCWGTLFGLETWWGTRGFFVELAEVLIPAAIALGAFLAIASRLPIPEVDLLLKRFTRKKGTPS